MNGVMYPRRSREDVQYEKETGLDILQIQRERLTEILTQQGHSWIERAEVVTGDSISVRPKFQQVLNEDIPGGAQFIAVTEIPRLGRGKMKDAGHIYETIIEYQVFIITPNKTFDPSNPSDLRQLRFELFMSREEYEMIKERLWNSRDWKATQGYAGNYIPVLGYRQSRGKLEVVPEEARLAVEIFTMRSEGYSYQEIANYLNSRGLRTKKGTIYHQTTIGKITRNPRYIGISQWRGKEYQAKHPSIIPMDLWNKVQEINAGRRHKRRAPKEDYLVKLYCHECGNRMYGEIPQTSKLRSDGTRKKYRSSMIYVCKGRKYAEGCTHQVNGQKIHDMAFEELKKMIQNPSVINELAEERELQLGVNTVDLNKELDNLDKIIKTKRSFISKLETDYESGELTALLYTKHLEKANNEIDTIEKRKRKISEQLSKANIKIDPPEELAGILKKFIEGWDKYPNKSKKLIIDAFLPRIEIDKQGTFYISRSLPINLEFS